MKGYLVDTNIPSELTREKPDARVAAFLRNAGKENVFLSVMTIGKSARALRHSQSARGAQRCRIGLIKAFGLGSLVAYFQLRRLLRSVGDIWPPPRSDKG